MSRTHSHVRRPRRTGVDWPTKLAAVGVAIVVAFALCEAALRVGYPAPPDPTRQPVLAFKAQPDLEFIHVPNQVGWLADGLATINAIGLRGDLPEVPKPAEALRVVLVGDSTTFGWGVGDSDSRC